LLSERVSLSSAEARAEEIKGGFVGVFELTQTGPLATHPEPKLAVMRLMPSHGWSIRPPTTDIPQGERDCVGG